MERNKFWWKLIAAVIALAVLLYGGREYLQQLHLIADAYWPAVVGIAVVHLLTLWVQSLTIKCGMDAFGDRMSEWESFWLFVISSYANLLLPRSGIGATALYLKRFRQSSIINYAFVVAAGSVIFVFACSSIGCVVLTVNHLAQAYWPPLWLAIGMPALMLISIFVLLLYPISIPCSRLPFAGLLAKLQAATGRLSKSHAVWQIGLSHFVLVFLRAFRLQLAFMALDINVPFLGVLSASILGDLAFVIAITPGALGFREAAIGMASVYLGVPVAIAVTVAVLDRLVFSSTVIVAAQILIARGIKDPCSNSSEHCSSAGQNSWQP